jgi:spore coat polysaccharide biosynthesis predicted glycosyltransferase SpsG
MQNTIKFKNILFFCEISKKIGGGHYIRNHRLYIYLKKKYNCKFFVNKKQKDIKKIIKNNNNSIIIFDFKKYSKKLYLNQPKNFYLNFDSKKKFTTHSININPLSLKNDNYSGPKWFIYPSSFKKKLIKNTKVKNLFICQGFTDANNNIEKILKLVLKPSIQMNLKIFIKVPYKNYLSKYLIKQKNIIEVSKITDLFNFLSKMDVAISSTGNFSYELGYLKIPCIYFSDEYNEIKRGKIYQKKNIGKIFTSKSKSKIIEELTKLVIDKKYFLKVMNKQNKIFFNNTILNYEKLIKKIQYEKI